MKKRFYNALLLVAIICATVGSFVSCKDYNEDLYADLQGQMQDQNATLEQIINTQVAALEEQITKLEEAQKECKENCEAWKQEIKIWQEYVENNYVTIEEYNKHLAEFATHIAQNEAEHQALQKSINEINSKLAETEKTLKELKEADAALKEELQKELLRLQNELNSLTVYLKTQLSEMTQTIEQNKKDLEDAIAENKRQLEEAIQDAKDELNDAIADAKKELADKITADISNLEKRVAANEKSITSLQTQVGVLDVAVAGILVTLNSVISDVAEAQALAERDSIRIDALESSLQELKEQHKKDNDLLTAKVDSICNELNTIKESVTEAMKLANDNLVEAKKYTNDRINDVLSQINGINTTLTQLNAAYKEADAKLQDQIDNLKSLVESVMRRVKENANQIKKLTDLFNKVDESLKQFITSILIQGTENPVIGSYSAPANIQTNVLMSYYGYAGSYGAQFPTYYPRYYVRDNEVLSQKDIEMLGVTPETLAEDGEAIVSSAGKIYVTINPSNVNFEGQTLPIVNSIEEESGIKLSPLAYSDKKLTFGYTRSAANGLYEAEATLAAEDIESVAMTFDFNKGEIKETVKDILTPTNGINATQVANTVIDVLNQFNQQLDANALKATWTDELGVTRSIYSQYNLATTAIKPLSYSFMKDANYTSFPGFDKMQNFTGNILDKIANKLKLVMPDITLDLDIEKIDKITFDSININFDDINLDIVVEYDTIINTSVTVTIDKLIDLDVNVPSQSVHVEIPVAGEVKDALGNIVGYFDTTVPYDVVVPQQNIQDKVPFTWSGNVPVEVPLHIKVPVDMTEFEKLLREIECLESDINGMLAGQQDNINNIINTVNSYLDELGSLTELTDKLANIDTEIDNAVVNLKNKVINFLDKVENKLLSAVNSINKTLQPIMLVKTTDGFQKLSQTIYSPTWMTSGDVQFIPTSYTAEILAPAYKKLVGVTNVYSMDRSKNAQVDGGEYMSALAAANGQAGIAEILDGDTMVVNFSAKKGYIYEVTYTSVDFSGMEVAKKFYVTVK
ncbi:MAG: hypothetical protein IKY75_05805 [Bacteroidaceae bacterium]|nr:hypothetical protein [Bacteroidaceae bacterium]